ncbi:MAG: hypothetical protein RLO12_19205 [Fulvivirga sp.]
MAFLTRDQIKNFASNALHEVADFNGDIDNYTFNNFHEFHRKVYVNELKRQIMSSPYFDREGNESMDRYYDVPLSMGVANGWTQIKESIDYVVANQAVRARNPNKVTLP